MALPDLIQLKTNNAKRPPVADWRHSEASLWVQPAHEANGYVAL